ncbi:hypothetical protein N9N28_05470 [Rubripirellula amarantea]|nr:hypothetical protein [Rubripirellula amarantea]
MYCSSADRFRSSLRKGSSYLEVQVAMVLLAISTAGLYSVSIANTKQTSALVNRTFNSFADEDAAINAHPDEWARKLGVIAELDEVVSPAGTVVPDTFFSKITDNTSAADNIFFRASSDYYQWYDWTTSLGYGGNAKYHYQPTDIGEGSYTEQRITGIPAGTYEILITHPTLSVLAAETIYHIFDGSAATPVSVVSVDQRVSCNDTRFGGHSWKRIEVMPITSGTLRIRINDGPAGRSFVISDAIAVRSRRFELVSVTPSNTGGATAALEIP